MTFNKQGLIDEYNKYYYRAVKCIGNDDEKALGYIQYIATIAWYYPVIYNFIDEKIEHLLVDIAEHLLSNALYTDTSYEDRIVFYNGQIVDNGGLTEQYLDYFISRKYKVLFIVSSYNYTLYGKKILDKVSKDSNVELFIPSSKTYTKRISEIYNKINFFNPSKGFLHFLPNDICGFCVFSQLSSLKRYYIVHNDHTFWLGKLCSDFFIEFRAFGYQLSIQRRCINEDKLLFLPYYPIKQDSIFEGFPFERKDKIVGLAAASLYKFLLDPNLEYFKVIKRLLIENENFIFCLAGMGPAADEQIINNFITNENLSDRFFYLGKRSDFYQLVGNVDILFESYPLKGGLTPLFATVQNIPIIGISCTNDLSGSTEDFFSIKGYKSPRNFEEFYSESSRLISNINYRDSIAKLVSNNRFNKESFILGLDEIIKGNYKYNIDKEYLFKLDDDKILSDYLLLNSVQFSLLSYKYNTIFPVVFRQLYSFLLALRFHGIKHTIGLLLNRFCKCCLFKS